MQESHSHQSQVRFLSEITITTLLPLLVLEDPINQSTSRSCQPSRVLPLDVLSCVLLSFVLCLSDAPKNTSVLARPSSVIEAGGSLTLTCSSQANPAVENYTWHRINAADSWETRSGQSYTIAEVSTGASGQYYCEARNRFGVHNSPVLTVRVRGQ